MEHRSAQAKQELILQEFLEKHHFDPPAAILPQLRIVTQKERDTLLKKGDPIHAVYIILEGQYTVSEAWSNGAIFIFTWVPGISSVKWNAIRVPRQFSTT